MVKQKIIRQLCLVSFGMMTLGALEVDSLNGFSHLHLSFDREALAASSGGRAGGGSFRSSPSRSSGSSGSYSSPSRSYPRSNPSWDYRDTPANSAPPYYRRDPYYPPYDRGPVIIPVPVGPSTYNNPYDRRSPSNPGYSNQSSSSNSERGWLIAALLLGLGVPVVFLLVYFMLRARGRGDSGFGGADELTNETVTVSKIQVALLAQARATQAELNNLAQQIDTSTPEGLLQLLQEAALALLRTPENWSHVLASSKVVRSLTEAEALFNQMSIAERSKFSTETLTNVGGRKHRYQGFKPPEEDPAAYIVVTFLVGTAHDYPLFQEIRTIEELKAGLEKLAGMPSDYLMVFELLWSPQEENDSLTYDELLTEYSDMAQL